MEFASPLEGDEDWVDAWQDDEPLRDRTVANIIGNASTPPPPPRLFVEVHLTHAGLQAKDDPAQVRGAEPHLGASVAPGWPPAHHFERMSGAR